MGVVPIGACLLGILAAAGYYGASLLLNVKPTKASGLIMILFALLTQAAIYYSQYFLATGAESWDMRHFLDFVNRSLRESKFGVTIYGYEIGGSRGGPEMGAWGYLYAFFQFLALLSGGFIPYAILSDKPFCPEDWVFHRRLRKLVLSFQDQKGTVEGLRNAEEGSRTYFERLKSLPAGNGREVELELSRCPRCGQEALIERIFFQKDGKRVFVNSLRRLIWIRKGRSAGAELGSGEGVTHEL